MIDFKNGSFLKLKKTNGKENAALINPLLIDDELSSANIRQSVILLYLQTNESSQ
jgi:hypothetical protein